MFNPLAADLKAGNCRSAQQDFTALRKDRQTQPPTTHHHHDHHGGDSDRSNAIGQLFRQLGVTGNLSSAQPAYAALQQDLSQCAQVNALAAQSSMSSVSPKA